MWNGKCFVNLQRLLLTMHVGLGNMHQKCKSGKIGKRRLHSWKWKKKNLSIGEAYLKVLYSVSLLIVVVVVVVVAVLAVTILGVLDDSVIGLLWVRLSVLTALCK